MSWGDIVQKVLPQERVLAEELQNGRTTDKKDMKMTRLKQWIHY